MTCYDRYWVELADVRFEVISIDLTDLYELMPRGTACWILKSLGSVYADVSGYIENADVVIEVTPVGVSTTGVDERSAEVLALVLEYLENVDTDTAEELVDEARRHHEFNEELVKRLVRKLDRVLKLYDGYGACYAVWLKPD